MDVIVSQQVSITDYMNSRSMFFELGGHFAGCQKPELEVMNGKPDYADAVRKGTSAYVAEMPSVTVLNLAKKLSPYPVLWSGFREGFAEGLAKRLDQTDKKIYTQDLAVMALGLESYPDVNKEMRRIFGERGIDVQVTKTRSDFDNEDVSIIVVTRNGVTDTFVKPQGGHFQEKPREPVQSPVSLRITTGIPEPENN